MVKPRSTHRRSSSSWSRSRVMASRAPKGSSIRRMSASWANARAMATRWRMPPESSWGCWSAKSCEMDRVEQIVDLGRRARRLGTLRSLRASHTFWATVSHGNNAASWNIRALRPDTSTSPRVGVSRSARRFRRVDLPQPLAPTRATKPPWGTSSEMRSRASSASVAATEGLGDPVGRGSPRHQRCSGPDPAEDHRRAGHGRPGRRVGHCGHRPATVAFPSSWRSRFSRPSSNRPVMSYGPW